MVQIIDDGYGVFHAVKSLYSNVKCAVKVSDIITPFLDVTLWVKKGCRLSSTLFAIYINDLAEKNQSFKLWHRNR